MIKPNILNNTFDEHRSGLKAHVYINEQRLKVYVFYMCVCGSVHMKKLCLNKQ